MKYVGYCRKSTDERDRQVLSIPQQIAELKEFCRKEHIEVSEYVAECKTAKEPGREKFNHLLDLVQKEKVQGIVAWHPDRLARNSVDGGRIIYLLDLKKLIALKFPTFWFENTAQGRFMLSLAFSQAKYYIDNLADNVKRGQRYKIKQGIWCLHAPLGYKNDRNTHNVVLDKDEARVVRKIFELYATGEYSLNRLARFMHSNGIINRNPISGGLPNFSNIREVLMRPFYCGLMLYKGELYPGTHEAIIDKKLFDRVQMMLKERGKTHRPKFPSYDFPFTGLMKCGYCGYAATAEIRRFYFPRTNNRVNYLYYHCSQKHGECKHAPYATQPQLEKQFREILEKSSMNKNWAKIMRVLLREDEAQEKEATAINIQAATSQLVGTEQKLDKLLEAFLNNQVDQETYQNKKNQLLYLKLDLKDKLNDLNSGEIAWIERVRHFIKLAVASREIAREKNNQHQLAQMLKKVGSKYLLKGRKIEFCLDFPFQTLAEWGGSASVWETRMEMMSFSQAKYYVDSLSENVARGMTQKAKRGEFPGMAPPGYLNDRNSRKVTPNKNTAPVIKQALIQFSKQRLSLTQMIGFFYQNGITNRNGQKYWRSQVHRIVTSPFYYGAFLWNNELYPGNHQPLITKKTFDKNQAILKQIPNGKFQRNQKQFVFKGLIKCDQCRHPLTAENHIKKYKNGTSQTFTYYRCTKASRVIKCDQKYLNEKELINQVNNYISGFIWPQSLINQALKTIDELRQAELKTKLGQFSQTKDKIKLIDEELKTLLDLRLKGILSDDEYLTKKNELTAQKLTLKSQSGQNSINPSGNFEPVEIVFKNLSVAKKIREDDQNLVKKAQWLRMTASNLFLANKILKISREKPWARLTPRPTGRNLVTPLEFESRFSG